MLEESWLILVEVLLKLFVDKVYAARYTSDVKMKNRENLSFDCENGCQPENSKLTANTEDKEVKITPPILFHGSDKRFTTFRVKGKKKPKTLRAKGRKCVYLHEDRGLTKRKYAKNGCYLYEVAAEDAKNYGEAINDENLRKKDSALTSKVWIALPSNLKVLRRWKIDSNGSETLEFERKEPESDANEVGFDSIINATRRRIKREE